MADEPMTDEQRAAQEELDRALAIEVGMTPEQAARIAAGEGEGDDRWKDATMADIMNAMELLAYFIKQSEKANKLAAKLSGTGGNPVNGLVAKMMSGK